jgi:hypothetical protein
MKTNKLKSLLIAACCAVTVLWAETQGMEQRELTLVGEDHSTVGGMGYCYNEIEKFVKSNREQKLNFFVEKDEKRLDNAFAEIKILDATIKYLKSKYTYSALMDMRINGIMDIHINKLQEKYPKIHSEVYTNILGNQEKKIGLIKNRFYFLTIIKMFKDNINIIPIDGSFEEIIDRSDFEELLNTNCVFKFNYELSFKKLSSDNVTEIQKIKDSIMSHWQVAAIRDTIMAEKLTDKIESVARNIAIVGLLHVDAVKSAIENKGIRVEKWNG